MKKVLSILTIMTALLVVSCWGGESNSSENISSVMSSSSVEESSSSVGIDKVIKQTKLVTYEGPSILTSSSLVDIAVEDQPIFVYETRVNHGRSFTYAYPSTMAPVAIFDFEGKVHVEITVKNVSQINTAIVRPLAINVQPAIQANKISFDLSYNGNYTVEYNNDPTTAIHLFANPIEENPVDPMQLDTDTVYIGPGIYQAGAIPLKDNATIYLAGGALVYGQIRGEGLENITIRGRGILSGSVFDRTAQNQFTIPIELRSSSNIQIEGITILDPAGWTITLYKSTDIIMDNVKIITARANGDGISVQSCTNVLVKGGFVRSWDDSLVVKNEDRGTTSNVTFDGVVVWTDLAQSMEVGYETNGPTMDGITFKNITVIHNFHKPAMSIHNSDDAIITNVKYQNITIEDGQMLGDDRQDGENDFLIDLTVAYNIEWTESAGKRGKISNVLFDNILVLDLAPTIISRIQGEAPESNISNVTFKNIQIKEQGITSKEDLKLVHNEYVQQLNFEYQASQVKGAEFVKPYELALTTQTPIIENIESIEQIGLIVPDFAHLKSDLAYMGMKATGTFITAATHGFGNTTSTPVDDGSGVNQIITNPSTNTVDGDIETSWISKPWSMVDKEFAGLTVTFDEPKTVGSIRILGNQENIFLYETDIQVWGYKATGDKYTRILSMKTYELTPQSGNSIDINIPTNQFKGIQLRIFRIDGLTGQEQIEIAEVEFYPPSLTYNKPVVDASAHADVYPVSKLTDGEIGGTSYFESASLPAYVVVDMGDLYEIEVIVMHLPPVLLWDTRIQEIRILVSDDNQTYTSSLSFDELVPLTSYTFNPVAGNMVSIALPTPASARYIKLEFTSNSIQGGYGAQISELNVYGS